MTGLVYNLVQMALSTILKLFFSFFELLCSLGAYQITILDCLKRTGSYVRHLCTPPKTTDRQLYHIASISWMSDCQH